MTQLLVLATGGTISSAAGPDGRVVPAHDAAALLDTVPGASGYGDFAFETMAHVNGWNVTPEIMVRVATRARTALESGEADGVIVTHGTDTIEETLFMADLLAGPATANGAIVFACAMRAASELSADGPRNLRNAIIIASDPAARGRGALLTINDDIHAARWAQKTDTNAVHTFQSTPVGAVGQMIYERPLFHIPTPPLEIATAADTNVALVKVYTGMDDAALRWHVDRGAAGLVVEGTGAGHVPGEVVPGIEYAISEDVPVVLASRVKTGRVESHYGGPGGGRTLDDAGVIRAGYLNSVMARIALMVALGSADGMAGVRRWFADAGF